MEAISNATQIHLDGMDLLKERLEGIWMTGDYDLFSRYMQRGAEEFYRRLGIPRGASVLDVACGSGQLALIAARNGARVNGCDIASNWIEKAKARAEAEGLDVEFEYGDAEDLPYTNGQFDAVVTIYGAMFAPQPELVASEMVRVCRPGGLIAMANWTASGFVGRMFRTISKYVAPAGMPPPVLWGDEETVQRRLESKVRDLRLTRRMHRFEYPFPPEDVVGFFRAYYGPMNRAFASLDLSGQKALHRALVDLWSSCNKATGRTTHVDGEYLEVIGHRDADWVTQLTARD